MTPALLLARNLVQQDAVLEENIQGYVGIMAKKTEATILNQGAYIYIHGVRRIEDEDEDEDVSTLLEAGNAHRPHERHVPQPNEGRVWTWVASLRLMEKKIEITRLENQTEKKIQAKWKLGSFM